MRGRAWGAGARPEIEDEDRVATEVEAVGGLGHREDAFADRHHRLRGRVAGVARRIIAGRSSIELTRFHAFVQMVLPAARPQSPSRALRAHERVERVILAATLLSRESAFVAFAIRSRPGTEVTISLYGYRAQSAGVVGPRFASGTRVIVDPLALAVRTKSSSQVRASAVAHVHPFAGSARNHDEPSFRLMIRTPFEGKNAARPQPTTTASPTSAFGISDRRRRGFRSALFFTYGDVQ